MEKTVDALQINPIGIFYSSKRYPYDAARQSNIDQEHIGQIQLFEKNNFEQALIGINGFSRIWLIYQFHHNQNWNPMILPPRPPLDSLGQPQKVGVFASRSPYRPNPIGISAVTLVKQEGLTLWIQGSDLLDETPIFDIKPYVTEIDSFPEESKGWLNQIGSAFTIHFSDLSLEQLTFLYQKGVTEIKDFLLHQLEYQPFSKRQKRVRPIDLANDIYEIAYRTWRIEFKLCPDKVTLLIERIYSGYDERDLQPSNPNWDDKYQDKKIHIEFNEFAHDLACRNKK